MQFRSAKRVFAILGITGILLLELGTPVPGSGQAFRNGTVTANVKLRKTPSLQGNVVSGLLQGTSVKIFAKKDGWYQVSARKYHLVFHGWVSAQYVKTAVLETAAAPPVTEEPEPGEKEPPPQPAGLSQKSPGSDTQPVEPATLPPPEKRLPLTVKKSTPPEAKAAAVTPAPEADKQAVAKPPKKKPAVKKTKRPSGIAKSPVPAAVTESEDDLSGFIPMALPVLAVAVLLIAVVAWLVRRKSGPKARRSNLSAEPAPAGWSPTPGADDGPAPEENELLEEDLTAELELEMEGLPGDRTAGDGSDSPAKVVSVYDQVMEKINRMSDVELVELLARLDE